MIQDPTGFLMNQGTVKTTHIGRMRDAPNSRVKGTVHFKVENKQIIALFFIKVLTFYFCFVRMCISYLQRQEGISIIVPGTGVAGH